MFMFSRKLSDRQLAGSSGMEQLFLRYIYEETLTITERGKMYCKLQEEILR